MNNTIEQFNSGSWKEDGSSQTKPEENGAAKSKPKRRWTEEEAAKLAEKYDRQKRALQRFVLVTLDGGQAKGMEPAQVAALREALEVLGWLPGDVRI